MPADIQVSFTADASALQETLSVTQAAVAQLSQSFADTSAISGWSQAVGASAQSASAAVSAAAQTIQTGLTTRLDPIGASAARLFSGLISGSETLVRPSSGWASNCCRASSAGRRRWPNAGW